MRYPTQMRGRRNPERTEKACSDCGEVKPLDAFHPSTRSSDGRYSRCRVCNAAATRAARAERPEFYRERARVTGQQRRRDNGRRVMEYLTDHSCVDCGESDPVVLEFDHVRDVKIGPIAKLVNGRTWSVIEAEIAKCEIRCANCHRRKTAREAGWYSYIDNAERTTT